MKSMNTKASHLAHTGEDCESGSRSRQTVQERASLASQVGLFCILASVVADDKRNMQPDVTLAFDEAPVSASSAA